MSPTTVPSEPKQAQQPPTRAACVVRASDSADARSSRLAAESVCEALRRRGVSVGPASTVPPTRGPAFFIELEWGGSGFSMEVAYYESPFGPPKTARHVEFIDMSQAPMKSEDLTTALLSDDPDAPTRQERPSFLGFTFDNWIGGSSGPEVDGRGRGGAAFGATALAQYGLLDFGLGVTLAGALFDASSTIYGVLAGVRLDPEPWLRFELLAEGGLEHVSDVGNDIFSQSFDGTATLPYVGGRASLALLPGAAHLFLLGGWFTAGSTTAHSTVNSTVETCFISCGTTHQAHTVGGPSYAAGLRFGLFFH